MISSAQKKPEVSAAKASRSKAPVFVLGCPRSGTTVLYHMLLSAGGFAVYRSETNVFNLLAPRFGGMHSAVDRTELMDTWLNSMLFRVSGLDAERIRARIMQECHGAGDFLRITMGEIAQSQGVDRWADCTPEHLLYMREIKREIPEARFIHIIRDGRDVALSYMKQGWSFPLPWDRNESMGVAGLYWKWIVGRGLAIGKDIGSDYREVRFEELVTHPRETLNGLSEFIDHDLNYETIQRAAIGSVKDPNTSFGDDAGTFHPVGRWKTLMSPPALAGFEALVGDRLLELGYPLASGSHQTSLHAMRLRSTYGALFGAKQWAKTHTPLGRKVQLGRIQAESPEAR